MPLTPNTVEDRLYGLRTRWETYVAEGRIEPFIEFAVAVNSLAEYFSRMRLPGLVRLCEGLEAAALVKLGDASSHPLPPQDCAALQRQVEALLGSVTTSRQTVVERRAEEPAAALADLDWIKPRSVWLIAAPNKREMAEGLSQQLQFFGFRVFDLAWGSATLPDDRPLAVLFLAAQEQAQPEEFAYIATIRGACAASQLLYLGVRAAIEPIVALMRAGIDVTIPAEDQPVLVLNCVLDLVQTSEQEQYRVLIVEDSRVAVALIQRTLAQHGIDTQAISDPGSLLETLEAYRPDLVLMDM